MISYCLDSRNGQMIQNCDCTIAKKRRKRKKRWAKKDGGHRSPPMAPVYLKASHKKRTSRFWKARPILSSNSPSAVLRRRFGSRATAASQPPGCSRGTSSEAPFRWFSGLSSRRMHNRPGAGAGREFFRRTSAARAPRTAGPSPPPAARWLNSTDPDPQDAARRHSR